MINKKNRNLLRSNFYGILRTPIVPAQTRVIMIYAIVFFFKLKICLKNYENRVFIFKSPLRIKY